MGRPWLPIVHRRARACRKFARPQIHAVENLDFPLRDLVGVNVTLRPRSGRALSLNRAGFAGGSNSRESGAMEAKKTTNKFSPEVRARAVRMVQEHRDEYASQWAAIASIAAKIGCTAETLRSWVRQEERDAGQRAGLTTDERARLKALERENRELRRANEILRKASAYFAQAELDRRFKP